MARAVFIVGDIVRVKGIPGPHMVIDLGGKPSQHHVIGSSPFHLVVGSPP